MIEQLESPSDKVLAFRLSGKLHDEDYKTFVPKIDEAARDGRIRLLAQFHDFHGWDVHALWDDIKFATTHCFASVHVTDRHKRVEKIFELAAQSAVEVGDAHAIPLSPRQQPLCLQ